jgi:hypothetical protein
MFFWVGCPDGDWGVQPFSRLIAPESVHRLTGGQ